MMKKNKQVQMPMMMNKSLVVAVPRRRPVTEIITKFLAKDTRIELPRDVCIMAASDARQFVGFQVLYSSIILAYEVQVVFVDLGLSKQQREWCLQQPNITLINKNDLYCPFAEDKAAWQTWNKPFYMANAPCKKVLWLDVDVIVNHSLEDVIGLLETQPIINPDRNPSCKNTLWQILPVNGLVQEVPPFINAGVIGLDFSRMFDVTLHKEWCWAVEQASKNPRLEESMTYYDQSALKWATYKCGASKYILDHYRYDRIISPPPIPLYELLQHCKKQPEPIIHYAGKVKPWQDWGYMLDICIDHVMLLDQTHINLEKSEIFAETGTVYVLHEQKTMLEKVKDRKFIKKIDLRELSVEEFQTSDFGENRFFLSGEWKKATTEYIGIASARWAKKYPSVLRPERLYTLKNDLAPDKVYAANLRENWMAYAAKQYPGIERYICEFAKKMNLKITEAPAIDSNNFLCHTEVFHKFMEFWHEAFHLLYDHYGFDLDFESQNYKMKPTQLYNKITTLYFANQGDLQVLSVPLSSPG